MNTTYGEVRFPLDVRYRLELPEGAAPAGGWPVLLGLHGFGDDADRLAGRLEGLADAPFARLYPDGPYPVELRDAEPKRVGRSWYQYTGDQDAFLGALAVAGGHLDRVLESSAGAHPLHLDRVAVLGYSQGGYLAGWYAITNASRFRGLVAISCRIKDEVLGAHLPAARGFPVLVLHGARDEAVKLPPQEESVARLRDAGVDVTLEVHDGGHGLKRSLAPRIGAFVEARLRE